MRAEEFIIENTKQLAPQLYVPHPKSVQENFKPMAKLWTSTAIKTPKGYTSDWVEWASQAMPDWIHHEGTLYTVNPAARILAINSDRDAVRVARHYGVAVNDAMDLFRNMPWDKIAQDYDGIHHVPSGRDLFMSSWDVESTAWLNTNQLQKQGSVPVAQKFMSRVIQKLRPGTAKKK